MKIIPHLFYFLKFLLNLLGLHWSLKLHKFKIYNSIIHHLHTVLSDSNLALSHALDTVLPSADSFVLEHLILWA